MLETDPLNSLASALHSAVIRDLPDLSSTWQGKTTTYRPSRHNVDVIMFSQLWSSTALGFCTPGFAGQSMTSAYTTIVIMDRTACVYFGEQLAYNCDAAHEAFRAALSSRDMPDQDGAVDLFKATLPSA